MLMLPLTVNATVDFSRFSNISSCILNIMIRQCLKFGGAARPSYHAI